jgi:hypothetical protein
MTPDIVKLALNQNTSQLSEIAQRLKEEARKKRESAELSAHAAREVIALSKDRRETQKNADEKIQRLELENRRLKDTVDSFTETSKLWSNRRAVTQEEKRRVWDTSVNSIRVFISHKTEHKVQVAEVKKQLKFYGVDCFVAHEDIEPTEEWQTEIENALLTMDVFLAIMTEKFHESSWTDQEIGFACARNVTRIAVRMGRDPYGFVGKFQGLTCSWEDLPISIVGCLKRHPKMVDALIDVMAICPSAYVGNQLAKRFKSLETLSDIQLGKFIANYNANQQVYGSYEMNGNEDIQNSILPHPQRMTGRKFNFNKYRIVEETSA